MVRFPNPPEVHCNCIAIGTIVKDFKRWTGVSALDIGTHSQKGLDIEMLSQKGWPGHLQCYKWMLNLPVTRCVGVMQCPSYCKFWQGTGECWLRYSFRKCFGRISLLFSVLLAQVFPQEILWNNNILVFCFLFSILLAQETGNAS